MHLFIVSEETLPIHLRYGFAGVTKRDDFDWVNHLGINASIQRAQSSMYADICRVHEGDEILFYLENVKDTGRQLSEFYDTEDNDTPAWKDISKTLTERSLQHFEILE